MMQRKRNKISGAQSTWGALRFDANVAMRPTMWRLTPSERWCYIAGIIPLAAYSPQKGRLLLVPGNPITAPEVADTAGVSLGIAKSTMSKLRDLGILLWDEREGCEYIADADWWDRASYGAERWQRDRYERWTSAAGCVSDEQLADRIAFYGGMCWICRVEPYDTIDHVKPLVRGGSNWPSNLRPACRRCNSRKGARWPYRRPA